MGVICLARGEESLHRVVAGDDKTGKVDEKLASNVEEDEEKVQGGNTKDDIDLRDRGLRLEVVEGRVLGELQLVSRHVVGGRSQDGISGTHLLVELGDLVLGAVLERHFGRR